MSKPKQVKLNGKAVIDLESIADSLKFLGAICQTLAVISEQLRELLGSNHAVSLPRAMSPPPPQAGELPPDLLPYLKKKSENAYDVVDASVVAEDGNLRIDLYKLVKSVGWAYSPAKRLIWKPKERRQ
jgi:hypothetical protein